MKQTEQQAPGQRTPDTKRSEKYVQLLERRQRLLAALRRSASLDDVERAVRRLRPSFSQET